MTLSCFGDLGGVKKCWGYRLKEETNSKDNDTQYENVRRFSMKELKKATKNFSTESRQGEFSSCYKGTLEDGTSVMTKVLPGEVYGKKDFDFASLVSSLSQIRHQNLVELIGCCRADNRMILVYEFVGDFNLDQLLFAGNLKAQGTELNWSTRVSICIGIARGLEYLHGGGSHGVVLVHRGIKPSKVVLDSSFNPKIVDFGIAHEFDDEILQYSSRNIGTIGYTDPEYYLGGRYTEKSDVYAFGILLLEVISGRKVHEFRRDGNGVTLVRWAWELQESDKISEIVDPTLSNFPEDEVKRFVHVALSCVQFSSNLRPTMSEALLMLLGSSELSKRELRNPEQSFE